MKRAAAVAGFLEVEGGVCKLQFTSVRNVTTATPPSTTGSSSVYVGPPKIENILAQISSGDVRVHPTKSSITARQLQCHVCYLQRSLGLPTGVSGGWNPQAQEMFQKWLVATKKGVKSSAPAAISDGAEPVRSDESNTQPEKKPDAKKPDSSSSSSDSESSSSSTTSSGESPPKPRPSTPQEEPEITLFDNAASEKPTSSEEPVFENPPSDSEMDAQGLMTWPSEWSDALNSCLHLKDCSGQGTARRAVALGLLKQIHVAKAAWDAA